MLKTNNTLETLRLTNNNITDVQSIGDGLKTNNTLTGLYLNNNNITDVQSIGEGLKSNNRLIVLGLHNNNITDDSGIQSIIDGLKTNNTLKELWVGFNQLSDNMKSQLKAIQQYKRDGSNGYQQVKGMQIHVYYANQKAEQDAYMKVMKKKEMERKFIKNYRRRLFRSDTC